MKWKAIARSAIGTSHEKQQMPCQDYGNYKMTNNALIGAVADGAGSAKYSDIGAKLSVNTVLERITAQDISIVTELSTSDSVNETDNQTKSVGIWNLLDETEQNSSASIGVAQFTPEKKISQLFAKSVKQVVTILKEQAEKNGYSIDDLACTLLIVIATPNKVAAMQIGDGFITVRYPEEEPQLLFPPDKGEYINETTFVTSANALEAMRVVVQTGHPEFICASTDGLERLAIRMSDWTPFSPFFQPLEQYLRETDNPEESDEYLIDFLNSDRLNARTDDDKTLLLCLYDSASESRQ
ncbi:MAG: PP2C family serine/threonine-protein phosphatase [Xenococcaceae cyanobacterium MO_188.B29]|nr:PP2C family serine/threonine-protein phosphatase [Xenococcaceae cyanobacterium MO_188.B29]